MLINITVILEVSINIRGIHSINISIHKHCNLEFMGITNSKDFYI